MTETLTFSIGPDGDISVGSYEELVRWLEDERSNWGWLTPGDATTDRLNIASSIQNTWNNVLTGVRDYMNRGESLPTVRNILGPLSDGPLLISSTSDGATVLDILKSSGPRAASFAAGFVRSQIQLGAAQSREDMLGALLTAVPDLSQPIAWTDHLKRERTNYRNATRSLLERVNREADERNVAHLELGRRALKFARRIFDRKRHHWRELQGAWQKGADEAVTNIQNTEASYKEYMKLRAPVEYWEGKARGHTIKETSARRRLYGYFPVTAIFMAAVFLWAANFLISHPDTAQNKAPVALYVVISGGLLLLSTIAFWVGRLLTKLYLSEHHLRNDAEERAVMTTTYLALINEAAASDTDRQIILNALFRATPDGIVKDDGPTDASVQGMLTRMLTR